MIKKDYHSASGALCTLDWQLCDWLKDNSNCATCPKLQEISERGGKGIEYATKIEEVMNWVVTTFALQYAEEKDSEKREILKDAIEGALRGIEHRALLNAIASVKLKREGGER